LVNLEEDKIGTELNKNNKNWDSIEQN